MGWLGWTEQQTLDTSMPAILLAYEGRVEMLKACFGSGKSEGGTETPPPVEVPEVPEAAQSTEKIQAVFRALAK